VRDWVERGWIGVFGLLVFALSGCGESAWNDPYPAADG